MLLQIFGEIGNPYSGSYGLVAGSGYFINNLIKGVMVGSGLLLLFYLIYGGFRYLTAGGDEKAVDAAKKIMTNAVIGIGIIAGAWFITKIVETILGISILEPVFEGPP